MYAIIPQQIPQDKRLEVNEKIFFAIDSGKDLIPAESIYNCYTGIGGLHNLKQSDFANYNEYANAKKSSRWDSSSLRMKYAGIWWRCFLPSIRK